MTPRPLLSESPAAEAAPPAIEGAGRPAWAEVDVAAVRGNFRLLARRVAPAEVLAVVKADAYGHGASALAAALEREGAGWFAVATVEEAASLRAAGVEGRVLVLGPVGADQFPWVRRHRLEPCVGSAEYLLAWIAATRSWSERQRVHLEIDTGMHRLGIGLEDWSWALREARSAPGLEIAGVFSHFAEADDLESPASAAQERRFAAAIGELDAEQRARIRIHLANSAGALHREAARHGMVRAGLALLGHDPARVAADLRPALSVRARVALLRDLDPGDRVGYGGCFTAARPTRVAVVPVGYADGYASPLGGRARALVGGRFAPVVGAVSMDMLTIDVGGLAVAAGDEVVLLGRQGGAEVTLEELAALSGLLGYELLCGFGRRLRRRWVGTGAEARRAG